MSNRRLAIVNPLVTETMAHLDGDVTLESGMKSATLDQGHPPIHGKNGPTSHIGMSVEPMDRFHSEPYASQIASTHSSVQAWRHQPWWTQSSNLERRYPVELQQNSNDLLRPNGLKETAPIPSASVVPMMRTEPEGQLPIVENTGPYSPVKRPPVIRRVSYGSQLSSYETMALDVSDRSQGDSDHRSSPSRQLSDYRVPVPFPWHPQPRDQNDASRSTTSNSGVSPFLNVAHHRQSNHTKPQRQDLAIQTDVEKTPNDEFSDESGGSDSFESESSKPSPSRSTLQVVSDGAGKSSDSTVGTQPVHLTWNATNTPRIRDHKGYTHMGDEKVALCVPAEIRESGRRNSATSLDSGRDSTYAASSESSSGGGHPSQWSQPLKAETDKAPRLIRSPSHTTGYQQQLVTPRKGTAIGRKEPTLNRTSSGTGDLSELSGTMSRVPCPLVKDVDCERYSYAFRDPTASWQQPRSSFLPQRSVCNVASWQSVDEKKQLAHWLHTVGLSRLEHQLFNAGFCLWTLCRATPEELNACGVTSPFDRQILRAAISRLRLPDPLPHRLPETVQDWLCLLNLDQYWPYLLEQGLTTFDQLAHLTWEDLDEIGIKKLGHQKKFLLAIAKLGAPSPAGKTHLRGTQQINHQNHRSSLASAYPGSLPSSTYDVFGKTNSGSDSLPNGASVHRGLTKSVDDNDVDNFPVPEPPPGFQDNHHTEHGALPWSAGSTTSCRPTTESIVTALPPHTSGRRSSVVSGAESRVPPAEMPVQLPYSITANRRSFSGSLRRDQLGSEPDLYTRFVRRSASPPSPSARIGSSVAQLTKWSSGQINTPLLRLPNTYQNAIQDPELKDMNDLREMLDALSENLTASAQM